MNVSERRWIGVRGAWACARIMGLAAALAGCTPPGDETAPDDADADAEEKDLGFGAPLSPFQNDEATHERLAAEALRVIGDRALELGLDLDADEIEIVRVEVDDLAIGHVRLQQHHAGVPVFGGEAIVHVDAQGRLTALSDEIARRVHLPRGARPTLGAQEAIDGLFEGYEGRERLGREPDAELVILRHEGVDHLTWQITWLRIDEVVHEKPVVFVDAHTGEVVWLYDDLRRAHGTTRYDGFRSFQSTYVSSSTSYALEDKGRKVGAYDARAGGTAALSRMFDADDNWSNSDVDAVSAHWTLGMTVDYVRTLNQSVGLSQDANLPLGGYVSADGTTKILPARVHVPHPDPTVTTGWNNASFDGSHIHIGDGDGTTLSPLHSLDIMAHELGHGLVMSTAGLVYAGEPGALDESFADIVGAMTERHVYGETGDTWWIGEDARTPGTPNDGGFRHMAAPADRGHPDHVSSFWNPSWTDQTGRDCGGVHVNSGIPNRVFHLVAKGGQHGRGASRAVVGIGADKAMRIWYRAYRHYLTKKSDFVDAMAATVGAAHTEFGYGSAEAQAVALAWGLVGVTSFDALENGGFDAGSSGWSLAYGAWVGPSTMFWSPLSLGIGGGNGAAGLAEQSFTLPAGPATATLTFALGVSTQESTSYPYDHLNVNLFDANGSFLRSLGAFSNQNAGYVQAGPFDLSDQVGKTVRLQFGGFTDGSLPTTFWIENVAVDVTAKPAATESVGDGSFELASTSPQHWTGTGSASKSTSSLCFAGASCGVLGGSNSTTGKLEQTVITIPSSAPGTLTFRLLVSTTESASSTTPWDKLHVRVHESGDTAPTTIKTFSNLDRYGDPWAWYAKKSIDLSAYRGSTVTLSFEVQTDSSLPTTFYVDEVSLR